MNCNKNFNSFRFAAGFGLILSAALLSASCISCGPINDLRDFSDTDLFPPVIMNILPLDEHTIKLDFNEKVILNGSPLLNPELGAITAAENETSIVMSFSGSQQAGIRYVIDASVADLTGNKMSFLIPFYGFNPDIPKLLLNEFTTQGSTTHPDVVELLITAGGNLAGLWVVEGTTDFPENSICLPPCLVDDGDYILIHFKPQGLPEEIDETGDDLGLSAGYDASPAARDFWVPGGSGLSGNNGVLAVYEAPGGGLIDAVLYSNRTSASDETYDGFGSSRMLDKTVQLLSEGGWVGSTDGALKPEDAVNPDDSTATRSVCRSSVPADTDSRNDWHIVPTSGSTFGEINIDDHYEP